jgi:hypothetical protein
MLRPGQSDLDQDLLRGYARERCGNRLLSRSAWRNSKPLLVVSFCLSDLGKSDDESRWNVSMLGKTTST